MIEELCNKLGLSRAAIKGVAVDSRKVEPGCLFFALPGMKTDGHAFLQEVAQKGALGLVISKEYRGKTFGLPFVAVEDVLLTLQGLAQDVIQKSALRIVAVTGSVGKTTTKEFIATLLEAAYPVAKTPGNANSQIGLPLSFLQAYFEGLEKGKIWVVEMGMSEAKGIEKLVHIAPPEVAVLTKVGYAHAEFFSGIEAIARAKGEIFSHPQTRLGIVNAQAAFFEGILDAGSCPKAVFGLKEAFLEESPFPVDYWIQAEEKGYRISGKETTSFFSLPFYASHLIEDFLAAALVARYFGLSWETILQQAREIKPYKMRFEEVDKGGVRYINDAYNASPESIRAALDNLPKPETPGRRIAILGEMRELGALSERLHREIGEYALGRVDRVLCLGEGCLPIVEVLERQGVPATLFTDFETLYQSAANLLQPGDVVLLKGANAHQLWRLLDKEG